VIKEAKMSKIKFNFSEREIIVDNYSFTFHSKLFDLDKSDLLDCSSDQDCSVRMTEKTANEILDLLAEEEDGMKKLYIYSINGDRQGIDIVIRKDGRVHAKSSFENFNKTMRADDISACIIETFGPVSNEAGFEMHESNELLDYINYHSQDGALA
jgi:hypothetical protein